MNGHKTLKLLAMAVFLISFAANLVLADTTEAEPDEESTTRTTISAGYRSVGTDNTPGRAREYDNLESSPVFNATYLTDKPAYHFSLGVDYLNDEDFSVETRLDTKSLLRLDLSSERFFHNLDNIPYDNGSRGVPANATDPRPQPYTPVEGSRPDAFVDFSTAPLRAYYDDDSRNREYGLRIDSSSAKLRIKYPDYPAHLNLSYWRYQKKGDKQMRFVSEGGVDGSCIGCHMVSKKRDINRITEEFKVGADAHAGYVDIALEALYRSFRDKEDIPVDFFGDHNRGRESGLYEHDEDPDSRLTEATLRLNTAPSGGFVGSASFTIGERKNQSDLNSVYPVDAETDYTKTVADASYTPSENWSIHMRYRYLDMDSDNTDVIEQYGSVPRDENLDVRDSMDITRAWYEAIANYRPSNKLTIRAEFRREEIDRSNTGPADFLFHSTGPPDPIEIIPTWHLPDEEVITRVKLGFNSRLMEKSKLKFSGWVAIQENDDPAYGTSFSDSQELFLSGSYNPTPYWGMISNLNLLIQDNHEDSFEINGVDRDDFLPGLTYDLEHEKKQQNFSIGTWLIPRGGLNFDLNYGYMHTDIEQDLLFGTVYAPDNYSIQDNDVDYSQTVHSVTLGMNWQLLETLTWRLEGYHIRSEADYDPGFPDQAFANGASATSSELKEISKIDIRQNGVRGRLNWQFNEHWECALEATFDDYDDRESDEFDGSVQTGMVSFMRSW